MKRIITSMGVLGVFVAFMACSSDDSASAQTTTKKQTADESTKPSSSASSDKKTTSSTSTTKKSSTSTKSETKADDSGKAVNDTIVVKEYVDDDNGTYEDPYFSSGIFCWTEGCESTVSSASEPPKSASSTKTSSASEGAATIDQPSQEPPTVTGNSMTDNRDKQAYKLQQVGGKLWMAQDLNYKTGSSKCFNNEDANCTKYGRLYTFSTAQSACPAGWRLPSREEAQAALNDEPFPWSYSGRCKNDDCGFTGEMGFHWINATPQEGDKNFESNTGASYTVIIVEKEPGYAGEETTKFFQVDDKAKYFSVRCVQE